MTRLLPLLLLTTTLPAFAQSVTVENFIGRIEVVEGREVAVSGADDRIRRGFGDDIVVDGEETLRGVGCTGDGKRVKIRTGGWIGGTSTDLEDYPSLRITLPEDGALIIRDSLVYGTVSDIADADIGLPSCGRLAFGVVSGRFEVGVSGSADISAEDVGEASLRTSGSGDFEIGSARALDFRSTGSGDLAAGEIAGAAAITTSGSGDAVLVSVGDGLEFRSTGSGDLLAASVTGVTTLTLTGSGDVEIDDGMIPELSARTTGSGDVLIKARVGVADLVSTGSGDFELTRQDGALSVRTTGAGDAIVNGRELDD